MAGELVQAWLSGLRMGLLLLERLLFFERLLEYLPVDTAVAGSAQRVGELLRVGDIANRRLIIATSDPNPVGAALIVRQGKATGATLIFSGPERADRRGVMLDHTRQDFLPVLQQIALWLRLGQNRCRLFDFRGSGRSHWPLGVLLQVHASLPLHEPVPMEAVLLTQASSPLHELAPTEPLFWLHVAVSIITRKSPPFIS